jgi:adenylate cyclase
MWTQHFDRPLTNIFALQDEIVSKVVTTLGLILKLDRLKHWVGAPSTDNLEAFDDFLRATEYAARSTKDDDAKARQWLEKAVALDPKFAQAYAVLGLTYWWDVFTQWSEDPPADLRRSSALAHQALALDDSNSSALGLLSRLDWMQRRFDSAIADAERAVTIDPNLLAIILCQRLSWPPESLKRRLAPRRRRCDSIRPATTYTHSKLHLVTFKWGFHGRRFRFSGATSQPTQTS